MFVFVYNTLSMITPSVTLRHTLYACSSYLLGMVCLVNFINSFLKFEFVSEEQPKERNNMRTPYEGVQRCVLHVFLWFSLLEYKYMGISYINTIN